jgi:hypothetical protein
VAKNADDLYGKDSEALTRKTVEEFEKHQNIQFQILRVPDLNRRPYGYEPYALPVCANPLNINVPDVRRPD